MVKCRKEEKRTMLKNVIKKISNSFKIVKCNVCDKEFDKNLPGRFRSSRGTGPIVYFCPECNDKLVCNFCLEEIGRKSFDVYSERGKGGAERHRDVFIICDNCLQKRLDCVYRRVQSRCKGRLPTEEELKEGLKEVTAILRERNARKDANTA